MQTYNLVLDEDMLSRVNNYDIYRSQEQEDDRPIIDGDYIQRNELGNRPPEKIILSLKW